MTHVLVTGATGFVGRSLCRALIARGDHVVAAVRARVKHDGLPAAVERVEVGDLGPDTRLPVAILNRIDTVMHLAARVHVLQESAADPLAEFRHVNVGGTETLARAAAGRVRRLVYVSSLHAMCSLCDDPLRETTPCRPDTPYGQSKWEAEQRLHGVAQRHGLQVVVLRPPPVYGPQGQGNLVSLLRWVRRGWPLPLARVANRRSLLYVNNLVDALLAAGEHPAAAGETFLLSDGDDVSTADLVRQVATALGRSPRLLPVPPPVLRFAGRCTGKASAVDRLLGSLAVDGSKIRNQLGWQPPETLADGLRATAAWIGKAA